MQPHEIEAIREEFRRQHAEHSKKGRKWSAIIAKQSGWGLGTLREFRRGAYHGNNELIAETLKPLLENYSPERPQRSRRGKR